MMQLFYAIASCILPIAFLKKLADAHGIPRYQGCIVKQVIDAFPVLLILLLTCGCTQLTPEPATTTLPPSDPIAKPETLDIQRSFTMTTDDVSLPRDLARFPDAPFYIFYNEDCEVQLELYYDFAENIGIGIYYCADYSCAFYVLGHDHFFGDDDYNLLQSDYGLCFEEYAEHLEYSDDGYLIHYLSEGLIDFMTDIPYTASLVEIQYSYSEEGKLQQKKSYRNPDVFGTARFSETSYYDDDERLVYTSAYITHGFLEDYYIYEGEAAEPSYCLTVDHMGILAWAMSFMAYEME